MITENTAYLDGWLAATHGFTAEECPFDKGTLKRDDWLRGHHEALNRPPENTSRR